MPGLPSLRKLTIEQAVLRANRLRFVLTDCDGVLTDGGVYVSERGEELVRFSRRDGMGVERLRNAGIECAIVTRERSPIVARRAEKIGVRLYAGVLDKNEWLERWRLEGRHSEAELAYMGDDLNDLALISAIAPHGLVAAPLDAEPPIAAAVHFHGTRPGGAGAFREFAEFILGLREGQPPEAATERSSR